MLLALREAGWFDFALHTADSGSVSSFDASGVPVFEKIGAFTYEKDRDGPVLPTKAPPGSLVIRER